MKRRHALQTDKCCLCKGGLSAWLNQLQAIVPDELPTFENVAAAPGDRPQFCCCPRQERTMELATMTHALWVQILLFNIRPASCKVSA